MIYPQTVLTVADNTGARKIMCIRILGGNRKYAQIGDTIIGVVKEAIPNMPVKQSDIERAIVVRTAKTIKRLDGMYIRFDDNAAVIINNDVINFYLSYSASELVFGINKQIFRYKIDNTAFKVKLGSSPFIINKGGNFNLDLYLFVYYKSVITFAEVQQLSRFTYSNLSGLETAINSTPKCDIQPTTIQTNLDDKFREMENRIVKLIENKNLKIEETPKLDIQPLKLQAINDKEKSKVVIKTTDIEHKPFYKWFF